MNDGELRGESFLRGTARYSAGMKVLWMVGVLAGLLVLAGSASDTGSGDMPWNVPPPGTGDGVMGGALAR